MTKTKGINLRIDAQVKNASKIAGFSKELDKTSKRLQIMQREQAKLEKLQKMSQQVERLNKERVAEEKHYEALKRLSKEEQKLKREEIALAKTRTTEINKELQKSIRQQEKYKNSIGDLKYPVGELGQYENSLESTRKEVERLANEQSRLNKVNKAYKGFKGGANKVKTSMNRAAKGVAIGGSALAAGGVYASAANFLGYSEQMKRAQVLSGASAEESKALDEFALKLASGSTKTATEVAQAMEFTALAGYSAEETMAALPGILALAEASGEEIGGISDIITDSISAFGGGAGDATHYANVLAKAATSTNTAVGQMGEAFTNVAPAAAALGAEVEETSALLGVLADKGIKGGKAGTHLKIAFTNLAAPNARAEGAIKSLGLNLKDSEGNFIGMIEVMEQLQEKTKGMTDLERASVIRDLFGKEAVSSMSAIIDTDIERIRELESAMINSGGAAEEMKNKMLEGPAGAVQKLKSTIDTASIQIGQAIFTEDFIAKIQELAVLIVESAPMIAEALTEGITFIIDNFDKLIIAGKAFVAFWATLNILPFIIQTVSILMKIGPIILKIIGLVAKLGPLFSKIIGLVTKIGPLFLKIVGLVAKLGPLIVGIFAAINWWVVIIAAAIAAVIALGILLYKNWEAVKNGFVAFVNFIAEAFMSLIGVVVSLWEIIANSPFGELYIKMVKLINPVTRSWMIFKKMIALLKQFSEFFDKGTKARAFFDAITSRADKLILKVSELKDKFFSMFKLKTPNWFGKIIKVKEEETKVNGSYRSGLDYVPFDGFIAELHKGERVLTAEENKNLSTGSLGERLNTVRTSNNNSTINTSSSNKSVNINITDSRTINVNGTTSNEGITSALNMDREELIGMIKNLLQGEEHEKGRLSYG